MHQRPHPAGGSREDLAALFTGQDQCVRGVEGTDPLADQRPALPERGRGRTMQGTNVPHPWEQLR